jgi:hypothetical protein
MFDIKAFAGGVQARTALPLRVQEPVAFFIDQRFVELNLDDAKLLRDGLTAAIAHVEESEKLVPPGDHHPVIGKSENACTIIPRSALSAPLADAAS